MENVAVIFGGVSTEHDISIITAISSIIRPLQLLKKYKIIPVYISKQGIWYSDPKLAKIETFQADDLEDNLSKLKPISLEFGKYLKIIKSGVIGGRKKYINIDLVFPAMHGTNGEDGSLSGLLNFGSVPVVGCSLRASVLAMDKVIAKEIAVANKIDVADYIDSSKSEIEENLEGVLSKINKNLTFPLFVKPAHLGSSIGISRVRDQKELINGLEVASHYDDRVLVEEEIPDLIEVTLPIIGNQHPIPALLERPLSKVEDFFDFDTKYMRGGKKGKGQKGSQGYSEIPAKIDKKLYQDAISLALRIYKIFGLSGISRVDMLINQKLSKVYFNEINPLPGGLYSHNFNQAGISNVELVEKLIFYAKERSNYQKNITSTFSTNYLKQF